MSTVCGLDGLPWLGQGALQDQGNMRNTLRANVAEKLADIWLATNLRDKPKRMRKQKAVRGVTR